ncbi:MAG TPA: alpha/beta hydrolase [Bryobacteraceae bacterium]|jgi:pimeloyl-ACP methyl ester carboxylesterase
MLLLTATSACSAAPQEHFAKMNVTPFGGVGNLRVRYLTEGKAANPAIVLIHGWTCSAAFWRLQSTDLSLLYRVISIDLPGHGKSDKPKNIEYTVPLFSAAIDAVMRDAHVNRAMIAGHSMGVPVAMQAIVDHPERFIGFVAVDGAVWRPKGPRTRPSLFAQHLRSDYIGTATANLEAMFVAATPPELRDEIRERMLSTPSYVAASASENLSESDVWTHMPTSIPTLVIVSGRQKDEDRRALYQEYFTNLQFELWEEAGHFLMMEQPARFNQLVVDFAHKLTAPPTS